jgi:hypothetical protein
MGASYAADKRRSMAYLCGPLRISAVSTLKNHLDAESRRDTQRAAEKPRLTLKPMHWPRDLHQCLARLEPEKFQSRGLQDLCRNVQ